MPEKARRVWCATAHFRPATSSRASRAAAPAASSRCSMPVATTLSSRASVPRAWRRVERPCRDGGVGGRLRPPFGGRQARGARYTGDSDGSPNSIFTRALIKSLSTPGLSLVQIAKQTQTEVEQLASRVSHEQTPAYSDNINGDLCCCRRAAASPSGAPPTIQPAARSADLAGMEDDRRPDRRMIRRLSRPFRRRRIFARELPAQRIAALTLAAAVAVRRDRDGEAETGAVIRGAPRNSLPGGGGSSLGPEVAFPTAAQTKSCLRPASAGRDLRRGSRGSGRAYTDLVGGTGRSRRRSRRDRVISRMRDSPATDRGSPSPTGIPCGVRTRGPAKGQVLALERTAACPSAGFLSVAFSADGARIATGNGDGRVRFWNVHRLLLETLDGPRLSGRAVPEQPRRLRSRRRDIRLGAGRRRLEDTSLEAFDRQGAARFRARAVRRGLHGAAASASMMD